MKKILRIAVMIALCIIGCLIAKNVEAETVKTATVSYGDITEDGVQVTITYSQDITEFELGEGWTISGNTATKLMEQGSVYVNNITFSDGTIEMAKVAVPVNLKIGEILKMENLSPKNISVTDESIASVSDSEITAKEVGKTTINATIGLTPEYIGGSGTQVITDYDFTWDLTVEDKYIFEFYIPITGGNSFTVTKGNKAALGTLDFFENGGEYNLVEMDGANLEITSSDEKIATITKESNTIFVNGISEGLVDIVAKYTHEGRAYTDTATYTVYVEEDEINEDYFVLDKPYVNISGKNSADVNIFIHNITYASKTYPEGYDKSTYYIYEWKSSDETKATVISDGTKATITGVSNGTTTITCTIKTADGSATIEKSVEVIVSGISEEDKDDKMPELDETIPENKIDNTVAPKDHADAGEKFTMAVAIVFFLISAILCAKKSSIKLK